MDKIVQGNDDEVDLWSIGLIVAKAISIDQEAKRQEHDIVA